jgi:hypothetical protein
MKTAKSKDDNTGCDQEKAKKDKGASKIMHCCAILLSRGQ